MESIPFQRDLWNPNLYDNNHSFVTQYGNHVLELLEAKKGERILDVGCGTGDLAKKLFNEGIHVVGIDKSANMINQAKKKYPEIPFHVKDVTKIGITNEFDAVFSNAALHWVKPQRQALKSIFTCLKQNGRFVAEFGGKGNVQLITDEIINQLGTKYNKDYSPWYYPSTGEYATLLEEVGFRVTFAQHYDRPTPLEGEDGLKNWIQMFALSFFDGIQDDEREEIISKIETQLKSTLYTGHQWIADYKRIRVIAIKE